HQDVLEAQAAAIRRDREDLQQAMAALPGITVYPSRANFILFRAPQGKGKTLFEKIRAAGVLIKNLHRDDHLLRDCLRVTVGTAHENRAFLEALRQGLSALA
ncbi:MAG: histidinol-phosphate aminotransferase, partial [Gammaproteobacteria bacterium]